MKRFILVILAVMMAVCLWLGAAAAEEEGILGKPFPDFTAEDTQGNTFILSEALKDHEAVLINLWATWCPPCEREFPDLNEAYEQYGDRVAFIALSTEGNDDLDTIEAYRTSHSISFPMGRDEAGLMNYTASTGIPVTVVVDRFGNAAFERVGCFNSAEEVTRVLDVYLGDGYTETFVLNGVPAEGNTRAFPVAAERALIVENESAKPVIFHIGGMDSPLTFYVVPDDTAKLRLEITAEDQPENLIWYENLTGTYRYLTELLDPERNAYVCETAMPGTEQGHYFYACLQDLAAEDPYLIETFLIRGDEYIEECAEALRANGFEITWEYGDSAQAESARPQAYILHAVDQYGRPVTGVYVNFCTDTACTMAEADENGTITFDGAPDRYHVQILKVPEGYGFDADYELYTDSVYGEWMLRIRKEGGAA